jgi:PAS domain S-box-containing protein
MKKRLHQEKSLPEQPVNRVLRESENRHRSYIEMTGQIAWVTNPNGEVVEDIPYFRKFTGLRYDQVKGSGWASALHPDDIAKTLTVWNDAVSSKSSYETEYRVKRHDGVYRDLLAKGSPVFDKKGEILEWVGVCIDITERKRAEEIIRESEAKYRTLVENIPQSIFMKDRNYRWISINENFARQLGIKPNDIIGKVDRDLFPGDIADKYHADDVRIMKTGKTEEFEEESILDGRHVWVNTVKTPVKDEKENIVGILGIFWDITERKLAEEELIISKERLLFATEGANLGIWNWNIVTDELIWSDKCKALFGVPPDETMSYQRFSDALHPDDRIRTDMAVKDALDNHKDYDIEYRSLWPDESIHWLAAKGRGFYDATGKAVRLEGIVLDVTERKQAEDVLRESEERYRSTLDNMLEGCQIIGFDWRYLFVNTVAARQGLSTKEELIGHNMVEKYPGIEKTEMFNRVKQCMEKRIAEAMENEFTYQDGSKGWFALSMQPVPEGVFIISEDITTRKFAEEQLRNFSKELEQKVKELDNAISDLKHSNQELEQFAYVASHDLQEPLRMVSSYTQLLERRYKDQLDQDAKDFIFFAVDGANRMQRLINDLLDYSRVTTKGKPFLKLDLASVLGYAIANLQKRIQETGAMIVNDDLPFAYGDEVQLVRVFQNLLDNAMKFIGTDPPRINVSSKIVDDKIQVSISDNGIGIDKIYFERVFTIFQRLHNKIEYPGTGIGLAICKRTIERHGGKIWFESEPGKGTTFYFTLNFK